LVPDDRATGHAGLGGDSEEAPSSSTSAPAAGSVPTPMHGLPVLRAAVTAPHPPAPHPAAPHPAVPHPAAPHPAGSHADAEHAGAEHSGAEHAGDVR
jgi:hypothetical protein